MEPSNKNFKYWFVNIFSVVISVSTQVILFKTLLLLLVFPKWHFENNWSIINNLLSLLFLFFIGFAGAAITIIYSTNKDGIHIAIASLAFILLVIFLFGFFIWPLVAYPVGIYLGHIIFKKTKHENA